MWSPVHILLRIAPVISGPQPGADALAVVDHVEAGASRRDVAQDVGHGGGVHLGGVVASHEEHHVLTDLQTQVSSVNITITGHNNSSSIFQLLLKPLEIRVL